MIEFAKLHTENALKAADNNVHTRMLRSGNEEYIVRQRRDVSNAYSLDNIK